MSSLKDIWRRSTLPLDWPQKIALTLLAVAPTVTAISLLLDPSWGLAYHLLQWVVIVGMFWRWFWVEGMRERFQAITDLGAVVGTGLYQHGEVAVTKDGSWFRVTPLEVERKTDDE